MDINGNIKHKRWICGDIHGDIEALKSVFVKSNFDFYNDELYLIGDLVDRGGYEFEVAELLMMCKKLVFVRGNHDDWFIRYLNNKMHYDEMINWSRNGGSTTFLSYKDKSEEERKKHKAFFESSVYYHVTDKNELLVHGGFDWNHPIEGQHKDTLMWDRELIIHMMKFKKKSKIKHPDNFDIIYIGHTPTAIFEENRKMKYNMPIFKGGVYAIDTGCGKNNVLTMMNMDTLEYIQSEELNEEPKPVSA